MKRCEICGGSGVIRLPVLKPATATFEPASAEPVHNSVRTYPCPECSERVPFDKVAIVEVTKLIESRLPGEAVEWAQRYGAQAIGMECLKQGFMVTQTGPEDPHQMTRPVRMRMGVVSPVAVKSMDQRIAERQTELAVEVIAVATRNMNGNAVGWTPVAITAAYAVKCMTDALTEVSARRASADKMD